MEDDVEVAAAGHVGRFFSGTTIASPTDFSSDVIAGSYSASFSGATIATGGYASNFSLL